MRRLGGRPPLQRRRDRRGTQAAKACAIIRSQLSQVAVTEVVTVGHRRATASHRAVSRFVGPDPAGRLEQVSRAKRSPGV